jgi:hypothetical protein
VKVGNTEVKIILDLISLPDGTNSLLDITELRGVSILGFYSTIDVII